MTHRIECKECGYSFSINLRHTCSTTEHYSGCHKVHIKCANYAIDEAKTWFRRLRDCDKKWEFNTVRRAGNAWLERWREKE